MLCMLRVHAACCMLHAACCTSCSRKLSVRSLGKRAKCAAGPRLPPMSMLSSSITQVEHPVYGIPYYMLHPCETASLMQTCLLSEGRKGCDSQGRATLPAAASSAASAAFYGDSPRYLVLWLSLSAPVVGLHVPLQLARLGAFSACQCPGGE